MRNNIFVCMFFFFSFTSIAQFNNFKAEFSTTYNKHPNIPKGLLEAISYNKTHLQNLEGTEQSCIGLPTYFGPMGIVEDGKGYFKNTVDIISELSGGEKEDILNNPAINIESYALALEKLAENSDNIYDYISAIKTLNELPNKTPLQQYAKDSELYSILILLKRKSFMEQFGYKTINIDLKKVFGNNLKILSAKKVLINADEIYNEKGNHYKTLCPDYTTAIWASADPSNYSSRNGTSITDVCIHTVQGTYAGCISWFQNPSANVSAHYVIRSSDGQITQMVCEIDKGWHVGSENAYTIGIEHEGFVNDPTWLTESMYESSADLVKDITNSGYGISPLSAYKGTFQGVVNVCYQIKGHVHFPSQTHTDPGIFWDWEKYYHLINDVMAFATDTSCMGTFTDSGGVIGTYSSFQSYMTIISPNNADSVVLTFNSFDLELGFDTMSIYDGTDTSGTLIGSYTGTSSPGTVVGNSGSLAIVFYSDCLYNNDGWDANWNCYFNVIPILGCMDSTMYNYNPLANTADSCIVFVYGCTDTLAFNFDSLSNTDDGSCTYACNTPISGLFMSDVIYDRATFNFDNMNTSSCIVDQLRIKYSGDGGATWSQKSMGAPTGYNNGVCNSTQRTDKLVLNLTPSTTYIWEMRVWYCSTGATAWVNGPNFTTADVCPNVINFAVSSASSTQATFTWDTTAAYSFVRIKLRVDTTNASWFSAGGFGVFYPALTKSKNGLSPGATYRGQARTWCNPTGGAYRSANWTPLVFWTQPTAARLEGENTTITNLEVYPNPSRDIFNITFTSNEKQDLEIRIINVIGENIFIESKEQFIGEYTKQIMLGEYPKAIYFLEIETDDGVINKKFILQ